MKNPLRRSLSALGPRLAAAVLPTAPPARAGLASLPAIPGGAFNNEALPGAVAVHPVTGRVYVVTTPLDGSGALHVFDGNSNNALVQRIAFRGAISQVAVNSRTNKIYVSGNHGADGGTSPATTNNGALIVPLNDGASLITQDGGGIISDNRPPAKVFFIRR